jgi:hypothetical protein
MNLNTLVRTLQDVGKATELFASPDSSRVLVLPHGARIPEEPHWSKENYLLRYAGGIPGELRIVFIPLNVWELPKVRNLEPQVTYDAFWFNPVTGKEYPVGKVMPDPNGTYQLLRSNGSNHIDLVDWVFVLENREEVRKKTNNQIGGVEVKGVSSERSSL